MDIFEKLRILSDAAKYDVACTSSGSNRSGAKGQLGNTQACGICHSFSADGRCISLLKVLQTNVCRFDCKYCVNRASNDTPRAAFTPQELADLTMNFYKRNYIEGLFLSSGVIQSPDYTCEQMIETLRLLREVYGFNGYIHAKAIPGADEALIGRLGQLADRMSVNLELPSQESLALLAPDKSKHSIVTPMRYIRNQITQTSTDLVRYKQTPRFAPAGQSTQMIVGATPDSDLRILTLSQALYRKYRLKRVFYSAYMPVTSHALLPSTDTKPPLLREHRLYQADWLLRFYGFNAEELLDDAQPNFNPYLDPKCNWALAHPEFFPVEITRAPMEMLLRVPGIGVTSMRRILEARRVSVLDFAGLQKLGVVMKRAQHFITCAGKTVPGTRIGHTQLFNNLLSPNARRMLQADQGEQLSFHNALIQEEVQQCLTGQI